MRVVCRNSVHTTGPNHEGSTLLRATSFSVKRGRLGDVRSSTRFADRELPRQLSRNKVLSDHSSRWSDHGGVVCSARSGARSCRAQLSTVESRGQMIDLNLVTTTRTEAPLRVPEGIEDRAQLIALVTSCQRPSVLMSEREISVLRRGLTKLGWKRSLYLQPSEGHQGLHTASGLLSIANRGLTLNAKVPHRGGRAEDFQCECGSPLPIPGFLHKARSYACAVCGKESEGAAYDGAIKYFQHQELAGTALALALVFAIERDKAYAEKAVEILLEYARCYTSRRGRAEYGRLLSRPEDEAACIIALAQAYDLIYYYRKLTPEQRHLIEEELLHSAAEEFQARSTSGSAGSWLFAAAGVVGFAIRDTGLVRYAIEGVGKQLVEEVGQDGFMPGPLVGTHFRSLAALVHLAEACSRARIDLYNWEPGQGRSLRAMFAAPLQAAYPSLRLPAIDDDPYDVFLPLDLYEIACRRWEDVGFAWALKTGYRFGEMQTLGDHEGHADRFRRTSFYAFLFGRDLPGRVGTPSFKGRVFPGIGLSTLRTGDDMMATLRWGRCSKDGDHDSLSFTLYANGAMLAPDYGHRPAHSKLAEWSGSCIAHNTVVVDGATRQESREVEPVFSQQGSYLRHTQATVHGVVADVDHTRTVILLDGLCVLTDKLAGRSSHNYDWLVRFDGEATVDAEQTDIVADWGKDRMVVVEREYDLGEGRRIDWIGGGGDVALAIWPSSKGGALAMGSCPAGLASRKATIAMCRQHARDAEFVAALAPAGDGGVELSREGSVVTAVRANRTDHVHLGCGESPRADHDLLSDGGAAAVRVVDGQVVAVAVIGGSFVKWEGKTLLECPTRVDCAEVHFGDRTPSVTYVGDQVASIRILTSARAMRVNGHRTGATASNGHALVRIDAHMLAGRATDISQ